MSLISFQPFDATNWHQEEPLGYSVFAEPKYVFTQHIYLAAYHAIMLQASWHIGEGK